MSGFKIDGGTIRGSKDGSDRSAVTTGTGKGTIFDPHTHTTFDFDSNGYVSNFHTTVRVDGKTITIK